MYFYMIYVYVCVVFIFSSYMTLNIQTKINIFLQLNDELLYYLILKSTTTSRMYCGNDFKQIISINIL